MGKTTALKTARNEFEKTVTFDDAIQAMATGDYAKFENFAEGVSQTPRTVASWKVVSETGAGGDWVWNGDYTGDETVEQIKQDWKDSQ